MAMWRLSFLIAALMLGAPAGTPAAADVQQIRILDGRTIIMDGLGVRLCGITAPPADTEAGKAAKDTMAQIIASRRVMCVPVNSGSPCDGYYPPRSGKLYVSQCWAGKTDIALEMIRRGAARAVPEWSDGYYR